MSRRSASPNSPTAAAVETRRARSPVRLLHDLSLDAPLVAALWFEFFMTALGVDPLRAKQRIFLPLGGVWLAYAGDRLADVARDRHKLGRRDSTRHRVLDRHFRVFVLLWCGAAAFAAVFGLRWLHGDVFRAAVVALLAITVYLVSCQIAPRLRRILPREFFVGAFFAAGTSVFAAPFVAQTNRDANLLPWLALTTSFAMLCAWNCILVSWFERDADRASQQVSIATSGALTSRRVGRWGTALSGAAIAAALLSLVLVDAASLGVLTFVAAATLAALALGLLFGRAAKGSVPDAAALCDFALLAPAPLLPVRFFT